MHYLSFFVACRARRTAHDAQKDVLSLVRESNVQRHMRHWRLVRNRWRDARDEWHYSVPEDDPEYMDALRSLANS
jgi:hypothetical protein